MKQYYAIENCLSSWPVLYIKYENENIWFVQNRLLAS